MGFTEALPFADDDVAMVAMWVGEDNEDSSDLIKAFRNNEKSKIDQLKVELEQNHREDLHSR